MRCFTRWSKTSALATSFAAMSLVIGCTAQKPAAEKKEPPEVLVSPPTVGEVTDFEDFTGRVEALKTVEVRARVTGYLEKFLFEEGRDVQEGEVLFQIDARPYKAALDQAIAEVDQAQAQIAKADADFQRARGSLSKNAISRSDYDIAAAAFAEAKAANGVAEAKRETALLNFEWTKVTAPISGQASRRMVDPGNLVQADSTMLTSLVSTEKVYINFDIDERTILRLRRLLSEGKIAARDKKSLVIHAALVDEEKGSFPHEGIVDFSDNRVDPATGTLRLRGIFDNPAIAGDASSRSIRRIMSPGLFARVRMPIGEAHRAILVPEKSLGSDQGQKYVYLVNAANEVVRSDVEVGALHGVDREVVKGISPTDRVIVSGAQRVRPRMIVRPKTLEAFARESKARRDKLANPKGAEATEKSDAKPKQGGRP